MTGNNCKYVVLTSAAESFTGEIRITNTRATPINGWNVSWSYVDGSRLSQVWNAAATGSNPYAASNLSGNATIQPGQTTAFGFQGTRPYVVPSVPVVSGSVCAPASGSSCKYVVTSDWNEGFTGEIRITNNRTTPINGWNVSWSYSDGSRLSSVWSAATTGSNPYTASNLSWNSTIQPGQTVAVGFQGVKQPRIFPVPVVSGAACAP